MIALLPVCVPEKEARWLEDGAWEFEDDGVKEACWLTVPLLLVLDICETLGDMTWLNVAVGDDEQVTDPVTELVSDCVLLWVIDCVTLGVVDWLAVPNTTEVDTTPSCDIHVRVPEKKDAFTRQPTVAVPPF